MVKISAISADVNEYANSSETDYIVMEFLHFLYYTTLKGISHFVLYYLDANTTDREDRKG